MFHTSTIEISRSALAHNLQFIKNNLDDNVLFSSVIKGNAYGHSIELFVPMAEELGVHHFSVFCAEEAYQVKKCTQGKPTVLIMGMLDNDQIQWAIENDIEFYVFEWDRLENAIRIAKKIKKPAKVHIEIETGMNRTGFAIKKLPKLIEVLKTESDHLVFQGLCTHFAGAESVTNFYRIKQQQKVYKNALINLSKHFLFPRLKHTACSAAMLRFPKTQMDMVRIGILQYGFFPNKEMLIHYLAKNKKQEYPLKRMISWKSRVMDVKKVKSGDFVGYGTSYLANTDKKIAVLPIGYSHGFSRSLSNQGRVLIHGKRVPVIGTVNMNMISVDVTNVEGVEKGSEVVIIGSQGDLEISVASFSESSNLVNYELLTRLPGDIPRKIIL